MIDDTEEVTPVEGEEAEEAAIEEGAPEAEDEEVTTEATPADDAA